MLLRRFTDFIFKSRLNMMSTALVLSLVPLIGGSISILIVGLVTLRKGAYEGTLVFCASVLPFLINYVAYPVSNQTLILFIATVTVIVINMLTWLFALLLRQLDKWSLVIEIGALLSMAVVAVAHFVVPDLANWWGNQLTAYFNKTASIIGQLSPEWGGMPEEGITGQKIAEMKQYATGFVAASLLMNAFLQLLIARWWQAVIFKPGSLRRELHQIRLSYVLAVIMLAVLVFAYLGNPICRDLAPIGVMAFGAAGLSLAHGLLATIKMARLWLALVYVGVMFIFPKGVAVIAIAAFLDTLIDFRKRVGLS